MEESQTPLCVSRSGLGRPLPGLGEHAQLALHLKVVGNQARSAAVEAMSEGSGGGAPAESMGPTRGTKGQELRSFGKRSRGLVGSKKGREAPCASSNRGCAHLMKGISGLGPNAQDVEG